jgi:hypothetical protein
MKFKNLYPMFLLPGNLPGKGHRAALKRPANFLALIKLLSLKMRTCKSSRNCFIEEKSTSSKAACGAPSHPNEERNPPTPSFAKEVGGI